MSQKRAVSESFWLSTACVIAAVAAGAWIGVDHGERLGRLGRVTPSETLAQPAQRLETALRVIGREYADPVDAEAALFEGAIPGMLALLDPHSQFFDPGEFSRLREEQRGSYAGVGMQIRSFRGRTIVDHPFPGSPAFRAGVWPGDAIREVDGEPADGRNVDEVAQSVRGENGTVVRLELEREGIERALDMALVREDIPRPTVPLKFFLSPGVGYLKISSFGERTPGEFDEALAELRRGGLAGLVLDLRGNPGGLLGAGVHIAGRFLEDGAAVVSHRGRASRARSYSAEAGGDTSYPIAALVDCRSASAAEIVAGALQDHDRGLVVGSNTFGKGLVQSVFTLGQSTGMVLTTARYYTPSGRLIQRPYNGVTLADYYGSPCSERFRPDQSDVRLTDGGRQVFGGAGITPDIALEPERLDDFERRLVEGRFFERFAQQLRLESGSIPKGWDVDEETLDRFAAFIRAEQIAAPGDEIDGRREFIRRRLKPAVYTVMWNVDRGDRVRAELDPAVAEAAELLPAAARLLRDAKRGDDLARNRGAAAQQP